MIQEALKAVVADLNAALLRQRGDSRDRVILGPLSKPGGAGADEMDDKICCVLTQIAEEKNIASLKTPHAPDAAPRLSSPLRLNLHLLFAAQCARYEAGLEMISQVIAYLHAKPLFTPANTPAMHPGVDRLTLEMHPLSASEQSELWSMLGADYVPSVLYSMRMLTLGGGQLSGSDPVVSRPAVNSPTPAGGAASP